ncbi:MAG: transcription termination/antitermination factor NusG [Candidatus Schekmanbacteria bacterium]|nr:transcription termination/antitermination factor NusG [Candidatus Schekmanbacteria bacterium]
MAKQWYIIHTYSGYEDKVKANLEQRLKPMGLEGSVGQVIIPTGNVVEFKKGQRHISSKKFYPGYLLVEMELTDESWHVVRNTPKVTGFVGTGNAPTPLSDEEVSKIINQIKEGETKPKPKVQFEKGEPVKIMDGPFTGFTGVVEEVSPERGRLKVMVSIFGRATPVELDFLQVGKA